MTVESGRSALIARVLAASIVVGVAAWTPSSAGAPAQGTQIQRPAAGPAPPIPLTMPNKDGTLKFAILGDFGTGEPPQYQVGEVMARVYKQFKFSLTILVGDNLYGSERPQDFQLKFERPYKPLLDAGVEFRASLGNHDSREQRTYKPFNMNDARYYSFKAPSESVRFFALESTYPDSKQILWIEKELKGSNDDWKIPFFHHPLYSSAGRHGSDTQLREKLEPLFVAYNVSVVFTGHDHIYERTKPQKEIVYFVAGSGGKLSPGDLDRNSPITAKGFDSEQVFMIAEIDKDEMSFNAVSRTGKVIDSGKIQRRQIKK
jgi:predicted MPP superfamily phosphohydrolase